MDDDGLAVLQPRFILTWQVLSGLDPQTRNAKRTSDFDRKLI